MTTSQQALHLIELLLVVLPHKKAFFLLVSSLSSTVMWAKSGTNPDSWLASPKKDLTPLTSLGAGNFVNAIILSGSGLMPRALIIKPANAISLPISNFFLDRTMFILLHLSAMTLTLSTSCGKFSAHTKMSSGL